MVEENANGAEKTVEEEKEVETVKESETEIENGGKRKSLATEEEVEVSPKKLKGDAEEILETKNGEEATEESVTTSA